MTEDEPIEARLAAVERRLDGEVEGAAADSDRIDDLEARLADLEAAVEALEGYVGEVERVDREFERRADAALAAIDDLEARVETLEGGDVGETTPRDGPEPAGAVPEGDPERDAAGRQTDRVPESSAPDDDHRGYGTAPDGGDPWRARSDRRHRLEWRPQRNGRGSDAEAAEPIDAAEQSRDRCPACGSDTGPDREISDPEPIGRSTTREDGRTGPNQGTAVSGWSEDRLDGDAGSRDGTTASGDPARSTDAAAGPAEWVEEPEERGLFERLRDRL